MGKFYQCRKGLRVLPLIMLMGIIFYLSHQPGDALGLPEVVGIDKVLHALAYGGLAVTFLYAIQPLTSRFSYRWLGFGVVLFCLFYGISDEFHQSFIPHRFVSVWDVVADTIGAAIVVVVWAWKLGQKEESEIVCRKQIMPGRYGRISSRKN